VQQIYAPDVRIFILQVIIDLPAMMIGILFLFTPKRKEREEKDSFGWDFLPFSNFTKLSTIFHIIDIIDC